MARAIVIATSAEYRKPNVTGATPVRERGALLQRDADGIAALQDEEAIVVGAATPPARQPSIWPARERVTCICSCAAMGSPRRCRPT